MKTVRAWAATVPMAPSATAARGRAWMERRKRPRSIRLIWCAIFGQSPGRALATSATLVTRSGGADAHAAAKGPPADQPRTPNLSMPSSSASAATSAGQSSSRRPGAGSDRPMPGRSGEISRIPTVRATSAQRSTSRRLVAPRGSSRPVSPPSRHTRCRPDAADPGGRRRTVGAWCRGPETPPQDSRSNQRLRLVAPNSTLDAARAGEASVKVPTGVGPERKSASKRATFSPPISM